MELPAIPEDLTESQFYATMTLQALRDGDLGQQELQHMEADHSISFGGSAGSPADALMCYESLAGIGNGHRLSTTDAVTATGWPHARTPPIDTVAEHVAADKATVQGQMALGHVAQQPESAGSPSGNKCRPNRLRKYTKRKNTAARKPGAPQVKKPAGKTKALKVPASRSTQTQGQTDHPPNQQRSAPVQLPVIVHPHNAETANQFFPGRVPFMYRVFLCACRLYR
jgi:hypothetical protein